MSDEGRGVEGEGGGGRVIELDSGAGERDTLDLAPQPNLGAERAAKREAVLEADLAARRARYVPPASSERIASELRIARAIPLVLAMAAVLGFGYWLCRYKVDDKLHDFWMSAKDLRERVMKTRKVPTVEDVRTVVAAQAREADCQLVRDDIEIIVEPAASSRNAFKLGEDEQIRAMASKPEWIVGYRTEASAKFGVYSKTSHFEHFTYLHDFKPPPGVAVEAAPQPIRRSRDF